MEVLDLSPTNFRNEASLDDSLVKAMEFYGIGSETARQDHRVDKENINPSLDASIQRKIFPQEVLKERAVFGDITHLFTSVPQQSIVRKSKPHCSSKVRSMMRTIR
uniref:Uncharacterized protein n=1 Tax=Euplotes crassus TaxID=5936 RepID=A0A7S3KQQ9_EUPCR|mmetsp:Transcript_4009/g.3788  ORF Transcript_4009/g.3788 Transcript_4009/m.3788 type:complete len:106 (+) Transcript_4009:32-349(+)